MPSLFGSRRLRDSKSLLTDGYASPVSGSSPLPSPTSQTSNRVITPLSPYPPQARVVRDLWNEAFALLPKDAQRILRPTGRDGTSGDTATQLVVVEKVMELTEVKYKEYCERGWHTKRGDTTKETNIKIKAKEIMCAALQFDDVVKAGLKFDPSGYGITVWGVLSGVMTLVQNDKDRADAVFDSAAVLARFLPKYAIIEDHYRDRQTQEQKAFEDQIRNVYASILKYAACVQKELDVSFAGRVLESFWTLENQDIKTLKDELISNDQIVTEQSRYVAHQYRRQEFQKLDAQALEALDKIDFSVQKLLEAEKLRTLRWLSDSPLTDKQQQLRSKVERLNKNSGQWLLESDEYKQWLDSPHSFLWLHGTSGCGKSMLCSTVVKDLVESAAEDSDMIVVHWYFDNADSQTQNFQRLLRFVLRQIAAHATPFPEPVRDLTKGHEAAGSLPGITALIKTLEETVVSLDENIFLVLDAIDEYQAENDTLREEFLDFLVQLDGARLPKLHILVTSILEPDIENSFRHLRPQAADMDVERPVSVDVDTYLNANVEKYAIEKHWSSDITAKILRALKDDGRFRIVSLQLEDLRKCYDEREIDAALESIPHSIEDAYSRTLQGVPPKDVRRLRYIFCWISVAARQLTTAELAAAPGIELTNVEDLFTICPSSMIRLEKRRPSDEDRMSLPETPVSTPSETETDVVTFDHPSVKRFLYSRKLGKSSDDRVSPFFISEETVNVEFVTRMINHLLTIEQPNIEPSIFVMAPFFRYTAQYWHEHLRRAGNILDQDEVLDSKLLTLFEDPMHPAYLNWIRAWDPERKRTDLDLVEDECPSPLYMAVFLRLKGISQSLIDQGSYINGTGGLMHTTLQLASQREEIDISQRLVESGEDVDQTPEGQPTALYIAVEHGNTELVRILLAAGAKPDAETSPETSVLQLASFRGLTGIVELLIAFGADVNLQSGSFGTALHAAAAAGHTEVLEILLDKGAKPDTVGGLLWTAIQAAETGGHSEAVKLLAARGVPWVEEGDSVWHEAYDLWMSHTPNTRAVHSFLAAEKLPGCQTQQMLAGVLKVLNHSPRDASNAPKTKRKSAGPERDAAPSESQKLAELIRRRGQAGMESKHYVYKAFFWAFLLDCIAQVQKLSSVSQGVLVAADLDKNLNRFSISVVQLAASQKAIEHGTSDDLLAARHEMVKCYALAFEVVSKSSQQLPKRGRSSLWKYMNAARSMGFLEEYHRQSESFEAVMRIARLQEPSDADTVSKLHDELFKKTQREIREGLLTLEEGMEKRLANLEHRVVQSVQDLLPGIIREEMRKLLAEQSENGNTRL